MRGRRVRCNAMFGREVLRTDGFKCSLLDLTGFSLSCVSRWCELDPVDQSTRRIDPNMVSILSKSVSLLVPLDVERRVAHAPELPCREIVL